MNTFDPTAYINAKYLFFTGKGGVGKTSVACATAINLADNGKKVLLISTDPASNLQDVFEVELSNKATAIKDVPGLTVLNLDPMQAAAEYRESVIAPYRGKLPDAVLKNMEEQLSGSCTVEIAAFNEFSKHMTDETTKEEFDEIIFDTAPTGHTLRLLQLPSAWSNFISESTHGASCLGQLSGLETQKEVYKKAVKNLADPSLTTLVLVTRPEETPIKEAERASEELGELGVNNQILVINGVLASFDDEASERLFKKQQKALKLLPDRLKNMATFEIPLRAYNIMGLNNLRAFLTSEHGRISREDLRKAYIPGLIDVVNNIDTSHKKVIFTMGKGGVGKTTIAAAIALDLVRRGQRVRLATTDPADHIKYIVSQQENLSINNIDEKKELEKYQKEVLDKARETMSDADIAYVEEDLRSPCTQEIAVFRAFADIVEKADNEIVIIDTAPTGHTLLLLDSTQSYHREVERTHGNIPASVRKLLPRLRDPRQTEVLIVTLAEATPVFEAMRLEEDLERAGIMTKWWIINASLYQTDTSNAILKAKALNEIEWINRVDRHTHGKFALVPWHGKDMKGVELLELVNQR